MTALPRRLATLVIGDPQADRAVPPSGITARLTVFTGAAMAFLAVFALAFFFASGRLADRWSESLARSATLRVAAASDEIEARAAVALEVLRTTPGVAEARPLSVEDQQALLGPWLGPDLPLDGLPLPRLIEVVAAEGGYDAAGLRARLAAELPGAVLDDHSAWRAPLVAAAERLRLLGALALALIAASTAAMIWLAAQAALSANVQVVRVLRLVGARDAYIARAFVRRFTLRALGGALAGTAAGAGALALVPRADTAGGFLVGLGLSGAGWLWLLAIPPLAGLAAFAATRAAALRALRALS